MEFLLFCKPSLNTTVPYFDGMQKQKAEQKKMLLLSHKHHHLSNGNDYGFVYDRSISSLLGDTLNYYCY